MCVQFIGISSTVCRIHTVADSNVTDAHLAVINGGKIDPGATTIVTTEGEGW